MWNKKYLAITATAMMMAACGVDKNSAEYDERRYIELQDSHCGEMASLLAKPLLTEEPQDFDAVIRRCEDLKSLSFEEYKRMSDYARNTGSWDVYELFPEKRPTADELEAAKKVRETAEQAYQ